ncbi:MAG: response regulator, partial [Limisphaerales bacterium]
GANGLDVLMWLRQNPATRTLPVIIYTSLNDPVSETEAGKLGIVAFVQKEATGRKLMEALLPLL